MENTIIFSVLNAKFVHASPAPWCLASGVKAYVPNLYSRVRILEATVNQPPSELLSRIVAQAPAVVGFSCYLWNIEMTLALCTKLKATLPRVVILLGGPEVSYCAKDVLACNPQVDYILAGEGEESVPAFLSAFFAQGMQPFLPESARVGIQGLCGRNLDGSVYQSKPCVLQHDVPSPLSAGYADAVQARIAYYETSRGCPYACAFCLSGQSGSPRYFSATSVLQNLLELANSGTRTIKFVDRTFNANAAHANRILAFILEHYGKAIPQGVCFHFEIAGDILREETFALLAQMPPGAVQLEIGMQSFCEKTLEAVRRKTNTEILQANIRRLVSMGNMHIHIDLIAGLPYESLAIFAQSFNKGYALRAQMLQIGFLKLLHGSTMRSLPQEYPCEFNSSPPYQVCATPWLSAEDFALLQHTEDAVERLYNSGRFLETIDYVMNTCGQTPFEFFTCAGEAATRAGIGQGVSLDDYTAFFQRYCEGLPNVDAEMLRDCLVRDRLSTNSTGRLPSCLYRPDPKLSRAVRRLSEKPETAPQKEVRRGIALLYAAGTVCWVDYLPEAKNPVTGRWPLNEVALDTMLG